MISIIFSWFQIKNHYKIRSQNFKRMTKSTLNQHSQEAFPLVEVELKPLEKNFLRKEQKKINKHDVWLSNFPSKDGKTSYDIRLTTILQENGLERIATQKGHESSDFILLHGKVVWKYSENFLRHKSYKHYQECKIKFYQTSSKAILVLQESW